MIDAGEVKSSDLGPIIGDDDLWDPKSGDDILVHKLSDLGLSCTRHRFSFGPFGEDSHAKIFSITGRCR